MPRIRSALLAVLATGSVILLAGCAPAGESDGDSLSYEDSPLSKVLAELDPGYDDDDWAEEQKRVEELVAACMNDEGFDYIPVDQSQHAAAFDDTDWEERQTEEWIAQNGWGMVQTQEEMEAQQDQAEEFVDPNQPYVESLSAGEQEAYWATLHGPPVPADETNEDGSYEYDWTKAGCFGAAQHEVEEQRGGNYWEDEEFTPLTDAMNEMWQKVAETDEMRALDRSWSECMADAGYPGLATRSDAQTELNDRLNEFYSSMTPDQPEPDYSRLDELKELEIETALADFRCAEELDYEDTQLKAQFEVEEQFIADHRAELDALVAAYSQKG